MDSFTTRLERARKAAGMTITALALWLHSPYPSVHRWRGGRHDPPEYLMPQLEERLTWLEDAIAAKTLPLPPSVRGALSRRRTLAMICLGYERNANLGAVS